MSFTHYGTVYMLHIHVLYVLYRTNLNLTTQPASSRLKRDASTASRSSSVVAKTLAPKHKDTGSLRYSTQM